MVNNGKRFETNFKKSIPSTLFYYRFKDGTSSWDGGTKARFQAKNICDCMIWDSETLFFLELKSTKGKSLPCNNVRTNQIDELLSASQYANTICGFVIEFSDVNECYFVEINQYKMFFEENDRKSLPIDYCSKKGIKIEIINKKINRLFNIEKFLEDCICLI